MRCPCSLFVVLAALLLVIPGGVARAEKPPPMPAWHEGEIVIFTVVNANVVGIESERIEENVAIPLYAFGPPGNQPQFDVLSAVPGERDYNPHWEVFLVVVLNGRDVTTDPFTSEAELLTAEANGEVAIIETGFVFLCQVISK